MMVSSWDSEYGSITKQIHIDASPQVVYEVISSPEHVVQWWSDEADFEPIPGSAGVLVWRERATTKRDYGYVVQMTVVEAVAAERFSFRWVSPEGEVPTEANSMLVTFALAPEGEGTLLTVTEEGMREQGWEAAVLEDYYNSHDNGWARHLANLAIYSANLATAVVDVEYGSIENQIRIDAPPHVVYEIISSPEHIARWWFDEADFEPTPGSIGVLAAGTGPSRIEVPIAVVEALPSVLFSFRWVAPPAPAVHPQATLTARNSVLITFQLASDGGEGTLLTVTEEGMRELGWNAAVLEDYYNSHGKVWASLITDLPAYVANLATHATER